MFHGILSIIWCVVCVVLNFPWPAFFLPACFYIGREHAQAEYRYIEVHGEARKKCPLWCGFMPEAWTLKGLLDWILPLGVALGVVVLSYLLGLN